jgi:predicted Zn-dependent protease
VRALLALARGRGTDAVAALEPARAYERSAFFLVPYLRGRSLRAANRPTEAAKELQAMIARPQARITAIDSLARLELARALAAAGEAAGARRTYEDLLAVWKDADPDLPVLVEARAEYARLGT